MKFSLLKYSCVFMLILFSLETYSQEKGIKGYMKRRAAKKEAAIEEGRPFLSILAGPGYTPENGLLLGGGILYTFKTNPEDSLIQRSSIPINTFISTKGNYGFSAKMASFWFQDKLRFNFVGKFSNANDNYFGVGFSEINRISQGDSTTAYERQKFQIAPTVLFRILQNVYAGVGIDLNQSRVTELNPYMQQNEYYNRFGPENFNSGLKLTANYDSRDITVNAWKGWFVNFNATFFGDYLGGDNEYNVYELDIRTYHQINREGNTLALKLYGRVGTGDVPYEELSRIGGTNALRGYIDGQYRDKTGVYLISEWRHMFLKSNQELSKHGIAVWLGSGSIANDLDGISEWIPNLGVGYRFEVQPRMNLRIDFGIGRESSGLYFNFTEAF
ncbi:hypothetical protein E0K83_07755 [Gramella sp. BOM4]|nr:hypothetical protein [Christiangramia bathymodioli]